MLKIRLRRTGARKRPSYRIVVAESTAPRDGKYVEIIGTYDPLTDPATIKLDGDRAKHWLSVGAQPTEQVLALLKLSGDWAAFKGEKAESKVLPVEAKAEFVVPEKGSVILPEAITPKAEKAEEAAEEAAPEAEAEEAAE